MRFAKLKEITQSQLGLLIWVIDLELWSDTNTRPTSLYYLGTRCQLPGQSIDHVLDVPKHNSAAS